MPGLITATIAVDPISARSAEEGLYLRFVLAGERFAAIAPDGKTPRGPVAVLTPVDPLLDDRVDALFRFRDALVHHRATPDTRLTAQRRRHLIEMLRAIDGRRAGATYQDIAAAVFGAEHESATLWKSMPLRDVVMRRVRTGFDLVAGGYRTLLHKHRAR
ncbi:DUF2285 domain-containing protein [Chelativorans salis]|uniref:DUF2285 domain-containing protein n=1 Tax=Chelativorans salis TaxID=2978478 RepID=A0ABT2LP70_9HYPH|nr:DUF2285 domain-containing protein [Chelativorans sp. EGI FJ00035]MCT7376343.1 DUF2285 domain-containing protein [Chelativorans sp. EGI FJ00035]